MNFQEMIDAAVAADRAAKLAQSDRLTLGEIIDKCEAVGGDADVVFDFEYAVPRGLDSWRGVYAELALSFDFDRGEALNLPEFVAMLKEAVGKTYYGYKGGEFTMSRGTPVWVANYRNSGNTAVIGVRDCGYQVVIETGYREA